MRLGPGKHLRGRTLMEGIVRPEEFDYFHEVRFPHLVINPALTHTYTYICSSFSTQNLLASVRVDSLTGC